MHAGLADLRTELGSNYDTKSIKELCIRCQQKSEVQCVCFQSVECLQAFSANFYIMSQEHGCDLFAITWRNALTKASTDKHDLGIADICPLVWVPCLNGCKELLQSLAAQTTQLTTIDETLKPHQGKLETQLHTLLMGVRKCTGISIQNSSIDSAISRIKQYWDLCRYQDGANIFMSIRTSLGLTKGDFSLVEKLAKEVK